MNLPLMDQPVTTVPEIPPIPWDPEDVWLGDCPKVTNYLMDAFESAYGIRPVESWYSKFPDGWYAALRLDSIPTVMHHVWGDEISTKLRRSGLDLIVGLYGPAR